MTPAPRTLGNRILKPFSREKTDHPAVSFKRLKTYQVALSIPHYIKELAEIRLPSELYSWVYFKFPNSFPLVDFPPYISVELTNRCNFTCEHCWRTAMVRPLGLMDVEVFAKIVDEVNIHRPSLLKLLGHGENTIHPRFRELMALLDRTTVRTMMYTNGTIFRFPFDEILSWNLHSIVVSVDGLDAESYEAFKTGGNYALLRKQVIDFYKFRNSRKRSTPVIEIRHIITPNESVGDLVKFRKMWLETADTVKFNYLEPANGLVEIGEPLPNKCREIRREMTIHWDGGVPLCGVYRLQAVGNVRDSTIAEIWRHSKREYLRECHKRGDFTDFPLCTKCVHCR